MNSSNHSNQHRNNQAYTPLIVMMGVSGCGKTSLGKALATFLDVDYIDGDDLHPDENVAKMAAGKALVDADRWPWLKRIGQTLAKAQQNGLVIACSALKHSYREMILQQAPSTIFIHIIVSKATLVERLKQRKNHYMPLTLLDSQLATLEPLGKDEPGLIIDNNRPFDVTFRQLVNQCHR